MSPTPQRNDIEALAEGGTLYRFEVESNRSLRFYLIVKRTIDIIGASLGIIFLSPIFVLVAILIKLEDPKGTIIFRQTRIGKNQKPFEMYKFRSMVSNAESLIKDLLDKNEIKGAMFKMKEDPRITAVGKWIRKTSVDELPQLWNVVRGEMSLVGPRPPLPREVAEYTAYDKLRLTVTPGCTGLWQVSGRNQLSFREMVELDIQYIEQRGILLDIKILLKTVKVLFGSKDAF